MKRKRLLRNMMAGVTTVGVLIVLLLIVGAVDIPTESFGAGDARGYGMMLIEGVNGPNQSQSYENHIKVVDVQFGIDNQGTSEDGDTRNRSDPQFSEITVVKNIDSTSPTLAVYCANSQVIPKVEIKLLPPGPFPPLVDSHYYIITLHDVVISKVEDRLVYREADVAYAHLEKLAFRCNRLNLEDVGSGNQREWDLERNKEY